MKATIWVFLFILIIIFVLTDTLDVPVVFGNFKASALGSDGFEKNVIEKPLSLIELNPEWKVFKAFEVTDFNEKDEVQFTIPNSLMEKNSVSPDSIKVLAKTPTGWEEAKTKNIVYNEETQYKIINVTKKATGLFIITWTPDETIKKQRTISFPTRLAIFIIILIILLFSIYHSISVKEARKSRHDANLERLENYLKKSLLAGHDEKEIRDALISAGWDASIVDQGIKNIRNF